MAKIMSIIKSVITIIIIILLTIMIIPYLPDIEENAKEYVGLSGSGTVTGIVNSIEYRDQYADITFENAMGETLSYKIPNSYIKGLTIAEDSYRNKKEIKIWQKDENSLRIVYRVEYIR